MDSDCELFVQKCLEVLPFEFSLQAGYGYGDLPCCVIDSVWSIGVRYDGVRNVVRRYREFYGLDGDCPEHRISALVENIQGMGAEQFADQVVCNRQRTSTRGGILKAEAVLRFAKVLSGCGVELLGDCPRFGEQLKMEAAIREIPGQRRGISLRYFFMLAGDVNLVKPDRMTQRFVSKALGREASDHEVEDLIRCAAWTLQERYSGLTARDLDHEIWAFESRARR